MEKRLLFLSTILIMVVALTAPLAVPVHAKKPVKGTTEYAMVVATGTDEAVAMLRVGKRNWMEPIDLPEVYVDSEGSWVWPTLEGAYWIGCSFQVASPEEDSCYKFISTFEIPGEVVSAKITISADNAYILHVNGKLIGVDGNVYRPTPEVDPLNWQTFEEYDLARALKSGDNTVVVYVRNYGMIDGVWQDNPTALVFKIEITYLA